MALGAACHPSTVLFVGTWIVALLAAMPFAPQIRTRRVMLLALHVAIGTAASAWVWWPFMQRVFEYGLPFAFRLPSLGGIVEEVLFALRAPATSFALVLGLGIVGVLFGLAARRPAPLVTAATIVALLLADSDAPYLLSGVAETRAFTRLQPFRFLALARPLLFAQAAYALDLALAGFRARVRPFPTTSRPWRVAVGGVLLLVVLRGAVPYAMNRVAEVRGRTQSEVPDPAGFRALVDWAGTQVGDRLPGRFARLMYQGDSDSNWIHHVAAETGLPVFFLDESSPVGVGRERIEDSSADSLRRFDVRWIASKGEPPTLGDPATERRFGRYYVREWPEWDGKFARVERGAGEVIVTDLRNQKIEVELRNTDRPALVALGTGYYPRWRAHLDGGREVPIYAEPSVAEGWSRVPAAWIPPGRATFTPDGPIPSDGGGRVAAVAAVLLALSIAVASSCPRRATARPAGGRRGASRDSVPPAIDHGRGRDPDRIGARARRHRGGARARECGLADQRMERRRGGGVTYGGRRVVVRMPVLQGCRRLQLPRARPGGRVDRDDTQRARVGQRLSRAGGDGLARPAGHDVPHPAGPTPGGQLRRGDRGQGRGGRVTRGRS